MTPQFQLQPFRPSPLWLNAHAQTILANSLRSINGVNFHRLRVETHDGDFLDLDFASVGGFSLPPGAPIVLLLHGLEGSARRSYACETYRQLAQRGVRAVGLNFRSCSGEMNRTLRMYHAGATDDVSFALDWLVRKMPGVKIGVVGFSLGANTLLKYLGEKGSDTPIQAAVAISPPFDLGRIAEEFESGEGRRYARRFLRSLQQKAIFHARRHGSAVDVDRILNVRSLREFDNAFTAPLHGFRDADEYYTLNSCRHFVSNIQVPTLVIRAMDDPFFPSDIPHAALAGNAHILPALTPHGGHVAFAEGNQPLKFRYWAERQAARYLAAYLRPANGRAI